MGDMVGVARTDARDLSSRIPGQLAENGGEKDSGPTRRSRAATVEEQM